MTKISNQAVYKPDTDIVGKDSLIGSDSGQAKKTLNFRIEDIGSHFNSINGVRSFDYYFYQHQSANPKPADGYFYANDNEQNPENITHLYFSKITQRGKDVSQFFESIATQNPFDLQISQKIGVNSVSFFKIDNVETFSQYYKLTVSKIFFPIGNGIEYTLSYAIFNLKPISNNIDNQLLEVGAISVDPITNEVTIGAVVKAIINSVTVSKLTDTIFPITLSDTGLIRKDIFFINELGEVLMVSGDEGAVATTPIIPSNSVYITEVLVTDASIGTPSPPITGEAYVKKQYAGKYEYNGAGTDATITFSQLGKTYIKLINPLLQSISGFAVVDESESGIYDGVEILIYNDTGNDVVLKHQSSASMLNIYIFKLTNDTDLTIPNKGYLRLKLEGSNLVDVFRSWETQGLKSVIDINGLWQSTDGNSYVEIDQNYLDIQYADSDGNYVNEVKNDNGTRTLETLSKNISTDRTYKGLRSNLYSIQNWFVEIKTISGAWIRKNSINLLEQGLKISSRSDGSEIGVVLNTDSLTVDRTRAEQDKDGTYALTDDIDNLTLEQARQNSNLIEGNVILEDGVSILAKVGGGGYFLGDVEKGSIFIIESGGVGIRADLSVNPTFKGIQGVLDFSPNYDDFTYVQKKWVDDNFSKYLLKAITPTANVTGTTAETVLYTWFVPANTFQVTDRISIDDFTFVNNGVLSANCSGRIRFNTENVLVTTTDKLFASITFASGSGTRFVRAERTIDFIGGKIKGFFNISGIATDKSSSIYTENDFNTTVDNYFFFTMQLGSSSDSVYMKNLIIRR